MKKIFLFTSLLLTACQAGGPITQADKDAIQKNLNDFAAAANNNSNDVGNGYADDIISMPPHNKEISGKESVVAFHNDPNGAKTVSFTLNTTDIDGNGDMAYARGSWVFKGSLKDTLEINDSGKFLLVLRKQKDASWKTTRETWNSDLQMPGQ